MHMQMLRVDFMQMYLTLYVSFFTWNLILLVYTWSLGGERPLTPLGNSLLLRSELVPIHE